MRSDSESRRRIRFERNSSRIVYDPVSASFVVSWEKCNKPDAERALACRDLLRWMPSVDAVAMLYDRGRVQQDQILAAAKAIGRAWMSGDRNLLDTEGAKRAAQLVGDLSMMCKDPVDTTAIRDIGQAIRRLLDEIAAVRFMNVRDEDLDADTVIPMLDHALQACLSTPEFLGWPANSMRRKFMFSIRRKNTTEVVYTLISLLFDVGACPILSLANRRALRMKALYASGLVSGMPPKAVHEFFCYALNQLAEAKKEGVFNLEKTMTQQQIADSLVGSSPV